MTVLSRFCILAVTVSFLLGGCALFEQNQVVSVQPITKAMTIAPPEPRPPDAETATQREVAVHILQLRAWGRRLKLQLETIQNLIENKE